MFFLTLFVIGAVGFLIMALMSFGHIGGARGGHHAMSPGHHTGHALPGPHLPHVGHTAVRPGTHAQLHRSGADSGALRFAWLIPTPIDVFSLCLGLGGAGILLGHSFIGATLFAISAVLAIAYNQLLIRPAMNFAMKWASRESGGLEGSIAQGAEAVGHFDDRGRGIVRLTLDGQIVQLLATLEPGELARGITVARGDKLVILEVDAGRNTCRVSRDLAA